MMVDDCLQMTLGMVNRDGLAGYLPTLAVPATRVVSVIEGIPPDVDHRDAVQKAVKDRSLSSTEFFFAVHLGPSQLTVGHFQPGGTPPGSLIATLSGDGVTTRESPMVDWWKPE
jgi:hypothetical protein